ncbi:hypothetical protein FFH90_014140 [Pseudomonas sp. ATCC 43928]|uniref:Uncharacterized protein n=1 Tax=Pseudomonas frederiksbergensis TaxID=104087 RepID=A0AB33ECZ7_9PSED|nr:hypothetical protein CNN82_16500 [Pseudomonas frederiksbergensis]PMY55111.1 hypothetical protein C1X70_05130 [Pseudomonas sp. FW305-53]PMY88075.1 hypothetical protein C1X68_04610 [Pseudomonas sp. FW303-C2]PMY90322.1 hypothetical protein C1X67_24580 [Pseudomonas sp. FW305-62]PNA44915.1 hypothetical protein C1X71_06975 [Pseudomonas sp. FW306-2-2C-A10BC]PNA87441.1 hypothetical protein C1X66_07720 [Pseudomonas sp. MPR-R3B]PNB22109.1 hypothetical protein C1X69_07630 [Pseudomonas sp. FW305-67]Q
MERSHSWFLEWCKAGQCWPEADKVPPCRALGAGIVMKKAFIRESRTRGAQCGLIVRHQSEEENY